MNMILSRFLQKMGLTVYEKQPSIIFHIATEPVVIPKMLLYKNFIDLKPTPTFKNTTAIPTHPLDETTYLAETTTQSSSITVSTPKLTESPKTIVIYPLNITNITNSFRYCNVTYKDSASCSCQDCQASCIGTKHEIVEPEPFLIIGDDDLSMAYSDVSLFDLQFKGCWV